MGQGLQVFAADGSLIMDTVDRLTRIVGSVYSGVGAGSVSVPAFSTGTPFYFVQREGDIGANINDAFKQITISGTTLSWDQYSKPATIVYGVY